MVAALVLIVSAFIDVFSFFVVLQSAIVKPLMPELHCTTNARLQINAANADVVSPVGVTAADAVEIQKLTAGIIDKL